jgi:glycosyltransferase involved in cell wall biosynthesis
MNSQEYDISVVIPAHNEGRLAHHTMNSLFRAVDYSRKQGLKTEIIVILDSADKKTTEYFQKYNLENVKIHVVAFGDLGLTRNYGVNQSSGKYVAFLDSDDLFEEKWLAKAYVEAERLNEPTILHPQYSIYFGRENIITKHKSLFEEGFLVENLLENNYWIALCFASRKLLLDNPYCATTKGSPFGYEDWHFYCEAIAKGIKIQIVPDTCIFIRRKFESSLLNRHNQGNAIIAPTQLFMPETFVSFINKQAKVQ